MQNHTIIIKIKIKIKKFQLLNFSNRLRWPSLHGLEKIIHKNAIHTQKEQKEGNKK